MGEYITVYIDDFGELVDKYKGKYKVVLNGSYIWDVFFKQWRYEIKEITPKALISCIFFDKKFKYEM